MLTEDLLTNLVEKLCYDYPNHTFAEVEYLDYVSIIIDGNADEALISISKELLKNLHYTSVYKAIKEEIEAKISKVV